MRTSPLLTTRLRIWFAGGLLLYGASLLAVRVLPPKIFFRDFTIQGPENRPLFLTEWQPTGPPTAAVLLTHGVSANRSVMSTLAMALAWDGYRVWAMDFWGHGQSRSRFDWRRNKDQIQAAWKELKDQEPTLPLVYIGHSMGSITGAEALAEEERIDAFVSAGFLPDRLPPCPTLVAMGRYEELFSLKEAQTRHAGKADVAVSPFSDHSTETWDPNLLGQILAWLDHQFQKSGRGFPMGPWAWMLLAVPLGVAGASILTSIALRAKSSERRTDLSSGPWIQRLGFGYRSLARPFWIVANPTLPRSGDWLGSGVKGSLFGLLFVLFLTTFLSQRVYFCNPLHPPRILLWIGLFLFCAPLALLHASLVESCSPPGLWSRFLIASVGKAIPLFLIAIPLRILPGMAFGSMMLCIWIFVLTIRSWVYAWATVAGRDYRTGAFASAVYLSWLTAFWIPQPF